MKEIILNNKFNFIIINICLILIVVFSFFVISYDTLFIDNLVYEFLINNFSNSKMDSFMINVTKLGDTLLVLIITILISFFTFYKFKKRDLTIIFCGSILGVSFINQLLKVIFKRVRPDINKMIEIGGYSFPSGHSMVSVVLYGLFAYFIFKVVKVKWIRNSLVFLNILVILLIGISRIYLGVHYFSDVIVGFLISIIFLVIIMNILERKFFSHN